MAAVAAGFNIGIDFFGAVDIGKPMKITWQPATGGAKATIKITVKSAYSGVNDYSATLVSNSTASSATWTPPVSLMNLVDASGSALNATLTISSTGATFDDSWGGPNFIQSKTNSGIFFIPSGNPSGIVPVINAPTFTDTDTVASGMGAYVIGKSKIKATWTTTYYYHATAATQNINWEWATNPLPVVSTTIPALTVTQYDSRGYSASKTTAVPSKTIYYAPSKPTMSTTYSPNNGDTSATIVWQLARDTDAKFAVQSGNYITLDYSISGTNTWTVAKTYDASVASAMVGTHSETITGLDPEYPYTFRITIHTLYGDFVNQIISQSLYVTVDYLKGGKGVAFGQVATKEGFTVYMPAEFTSASVFDDVVEMKKNVTMDGSLAVTGTLVANNPIQGNIIRYNILDGYDLNGYKDTGDFVINGANNLVNYPDNASNYAVLHVEKLSNDTSIQTLTTTDNIIYTRIYGGNPSSFGNWKIMENRIPVSSYKSYNKDSSGVSAGSGFTLVYFYAVVYDHSATVSFGVTKNAAGTIPSGTQIINVPKEIWTHVPYGRYIDVKLAGSDHVWMQIINSASFGKTQQDAEGSNGSTGASYAAGQVIRGDFNWAF